MNTTILAQHVGDSQVDDATPTNFDPILDDSFDSIPVVVTIDRSKKPEVRECQIGEGTTASCFEVTRRHSTEARRGWEYFNVQRDSGGFYFEDSCEFTVIVWRNRPASCDCCEQCEHGDVCDHMLAVAKAFGFDEPVLRGIWADDYIEPVDVHADKVADTGQGRHGWKFVEVEGSRGACFEVLIPGWPLPTHLTLLGEKITCNCLGFDMNQRCGHIEEFVRRACGVLNLQSEARLWL